MGISRTAGICLGVLALALPAAAGADSDHSSDHSNKGKSTYNAKGTYAGDGVVSVVKGNGAVKKAGWKGQNVAFDFSSADIRTEDTNADGEGTLEDVAVGSPVRVKARLPKGDPGAGPYAAERLDDKSEKSDDDEDESDDDESGDDDDDDDSDDDDIGIS
jgi:hypothetical protein